MCECACECVCVCVFASVSERGCVFACVSRRGCVFACVCAQASSSFFAVVGQSQRQMTDPLKHFWLEVEKGFSLIEHFSFQVSV